MGRRIRCRRVAQHELDGCWNDYGEHPDVYPIPFHFIPSSKGFEDAELFMPFTAWVWFAPWSFCKTREPGDALAAAPRARARGHAAAGTRGVAIDDAPERACADAPAAASSSLGSAAAAAAAAWFQQGQRASCREQQLEEQWD